MKILATILFGLISFTATAADKIDYTELGGYVEFESLDGIYGEPKVEINLGGSILAMVGAISKSENPELGELISKLIQVRVLVYELDSNADEALKTVDRVSATLKSKKWSPIISVNEDDEKVRIYMHMNGDVVDGMVVMVVGSEHSSKDRSEAVFINIIGEIDPEQISQLTQSLDIDIDV